MEAASIDARHVKPKRRRRWRWIAFFCLAVPLALVARPAWHFWRTARHDQADVETPPPGYANDASRMNLTAVREVRAVSSDPAEAERELAALLAEARRNGWKVSIAGARHSMGGHTIYPDGVVIDMRPLAAMRLDEATGTMHVGAGAMWRDVLAQLDLYARSVAIMQSNNSFSVGGSISVNCHGWQVGRPPIAASVHSFRLMLADGSIVRCGRSENAELFSGALGGYGLFGIILDAELATVPNRCYRLDRRLGTTSELAAIWQSTVAEHGAEAEMVFGRLNVTAKRFLEDAILYVFYVDTASAIPKMHDPESVKLRRQVFRGAAEDDYGKRLRWDAEVKLQPKISGVLYSRNQLFNEGVEVFQNRSAETTDILHEYFVPRAKLGDFVGRVRTIVPRHAGNLLNVTVRSIETDTDTLLRYATEPVYSLVMLFQQVRSDDADAQMAAMTRDLVGAALDVGGRYYLPYRLHATPEQFRRAYPMSEEFFTLKRKYDPSELFQNQFYEKYRTTAKGTTDEQ